MPRPPTLADATLRRLAWAVLGLALALAGTATAMLLAARPHVEIQTATYADLVVGTTWTFAGAVIVQAQPRNACGWLLQAMAVLLVYEVVGLYAQLGAHVSDAPLPGQTVAAWIGTWGYTVYMFAIPPMVLLFPRGRLPGPRWRAFAFSLPVSAVLLTIGSALTERAQPTFTDLPNPWALDGTAAGIALAVVVVSGFYSVLVGTVVPTFALFRAEQREPTDGVPAWILLGGPISLLGLLGSLTLTGVPWSKELFTLALLGPPIGIAVGIVRHRVYNVEFVLRRSLVLLVVIAVVGGAWLAIVLSLDAGLLGSRLGAVLIGLLALAAVGVRAAVQMGVDRWFFPHLRGSAALAPRIAAAVERAEGPREALLDLVVATRAELRLPFVGFAGGGVEVSDGERDGDVEPLPARALGRQVGLVEVAPRPRSDGFTRDERALLAQVAAQAGMLCHAAGLVREVEDSRARVVLASAEERRRLRNDLHDGLGPSLAGIALQVDALAGRLARDGQDAAADDARAVRERIRATVADVRAVSHGLRPPILDQIGLAEALRQLVGDLGAGGSLHATAQVDELDGISAAAEVATYAIAAEAVANAVRHSAASMIRLDVERYDDRLLLQVSDNGRGMPARVQPGVGLTSMRQRAAEVGGRVDHRRADGGGTVVTLALTTPVAQETVP